MQIVLQSVLFIASFTIQCEAITFQLNSVVDLVIIVGICQQTSVYFKNGYLFFLWKKVRFEQL